MSQVLSHALKATRSAVVTNKYPVANQQLQRLQTMDVQKTLMREIEFLRVVLACRTRDEASLRMIADGLQPVSSEEVKYVMDLLARVPETQDPSYVAFARRAVALLGHAPPKPDNGKIFRLIAVSAAVTAWTGWAICLLMFGTSKGFKESTGGAMSLQESVGFGERFGSDPLISGIFCTIIGTSVLGVIAGILAVRYTPKRNTLAILGLIASLLSILIVLFLFIIGLAIRI